MVRLEGANLREAYLRMVVIHDADLKGADFGAANLAYANFGSNDLSAATMGYAYLRGANLEGANLEDAQLHNVNRKLPSDQQEEIFERFDVNLKNALLTNANFAGADLRGVDLTGAKLDGAELDPVDLRYAEIEDEQLAQCWELVGTVMPDGSIYEWPAVRLEFTELLNGVSLPVTKQDLIRQARSLGCLRNVIVALMRLVNIEECTDKGELEERFKDETMNIASDVWVSLNCTSEPEKTTVTNDTDSKITIYKITSAYQRGPGEPKVVNRTPEPGESITFQSGPTVEENVLLERAMYNNEAGRQEGTIVYTSAGRCTARC
jgi:uncharacterized protein YjbI with pentapeptide repeats